MHLTLTATSTWLIAASLFLTAGVSGIIAADALDPQTHPSAIDTTVPEKPATPSASSTSDNPSIPSPSELLARPISLDFDKVSIDECIDYIRQATGLAIIFHPEVVRQLNQQTVTVHATDVPAGEILTRIIRALNARYEAVDDAIFITQSPEMDKGRFEETERLIKLALETAVDTQMNQKLIASLNQKTSIYFTGLNLYDTADILTAFGIPVQLDPRIEMHIIPAVDLGLSGVKFRYFINHVMRMLHLRYELRDGTLHILMTETAEALYPITPDEPEPRVTHRFDRADVSHAATWIGCITKRSILIDERLNEAELSVDFVDAPLSQVVAVLAKELNAEVLPYRRIHFRLVPKSNTLNQSSSTDKP